MSVHWITPRWVLARLGPFDLDPCACMSQPWPTARRMYCVSGLDRPWEGRIWLNPPYGSGMGEWLSRLADHGDGIALVFARVDSQAWHDYVWSRADGLLFTRGRIRFCRPDGTEGLGGPSAATVLVAYGSRNLSALEESGIEGALVA